MSLFKKLFGGAAKAPEAAEPEVYQGFMYLSRSGPDSDGYRVGGPDREGGRRRGEGASPRAGRHRPRHDLAVTMSLRKAKQMIDEQGDRIFDRRS